MHLELRSFTIFKKATRIPGYSPVKALEKEHKLGKNTKSYHPPIWYLYRTGEQLLGELVCSQNCLLWWLNMWDAHIGAHLSYHRCCRGWPGRLATGSDVNGSRGSPGCRMNPPGSVVVVKESRCAQSPSSRCSHCHGCCVLGSLRLLLPEHV